MARDMSAMGDECLGDRLVCVGKLDWVDYQLWYWVLVYRRKDWMGSDGKTVKPRDHETNPEKVMKSRRE